VADACTLSAASHWSESHGKRGLELIPHRRRGEAIASIRYNAAPLPSKCPGFALAELLPKIYPDIHLSMPSGRFCFLWQLQASASGNLVAWFLGALRLSGVGFRDIARKTLQTQE
jgi:hypothetical protein